MMIRFDFETVGTCFYSKPELVNVTEPEAAQLEAGMWFCKTRALRLGRDIGAAACKLHTMEVIGHG